MATRFEPLELHDPAIFGIRLHGAFGRGDRQRLLDLAERCLLKSKTQLVLDCRDLDSLGGGGATVLADLQRRLLEIGGEVVFVAAGEVIRRFLESKFTDLPLRCFETVGGAVAALGGEAAAVAPEERPRESSPPVLAPGHEPPSVPANDLDAMLDEVEPGSAPADARVRRTVDLVTKAYVSLDDMLQAAAGGNPTVLGEALTMLLESHDLAAETVYCQARGGAFTATRGKVRVPADGGIVAGLLHSRRPLTMLDLKDGELWEEESQLLEDLQPDLILPLIRDELLVGIAFLRAGSADREYGIREIFALDLLLRQLGSGSAAVTEPDAPERTPVAASAPLGNRELLLGAKLELVRGLQDVQDLPHFWQVFLSRLRDAVEVVSLVHIDGDDPQLVHFLAGEARRGLDAEQLSGERLRTFLRTLERPVEIVNMPVSLGTARDMLLGRDLQWLAPLRAEAGVQLGVVALGLRWHCSMVEPTDEIQALAEIAGEALLRLRENQSRADMSVGLLEQLLVGGGRAARPPDPVTGETVSAVRVLARELGLAPDQERDLVLGALLRDFGQDEAVGDDLQADRLTGAAWEAYRGHPDEGERRLAAIKAPVAVRDAVRHHHEHFDGRGFPLGLRGRDIPLAARLVAVAQHHALHVVRDGRQAGLAAVTSEAGRALDPDLVEIFLKAARRREPVAAPV